MSPIWGSCYIVRTNNQCAIERVNDKRGQESGQRWIERRVGRREQTRNRSVKSEETEEREERRIYFCICYIILLAHTSAT